MISNSKNSSLQMFVSYNKFLYLECNFSKHVSDEIFGDMSEHMFQKWKLSNYNTIKFLSMLDDNNKFKIFEWIDNKL